MKIEDFSFAGIQVELNRTFLLDKNTCAIVADIYIPLTIIILYTFSLYMFRTK